jgi:rhodanese-related sulfurtransferase
MFSFFKQLSGKQTDLKEELKKGAVIVDVRSQAEYAQGHVKNSINIPLNILALQVGKLDRKKTIITCCASGIRSASAMRVLVDNGFKSVFNGGSWTKLKKYEV